MPTHDINITASFVQDGDVLSTGLTFPANGLKIKESGGGSDVLTLRLDEVLSDNRALNIQVSDGDRTVNVTGDAELEGTNTGDETTSTLGSKINGATEKTTPVDADMVGLMDSAASNILKKLSWANIKATLFTTVGSALRQLATPAAARWIRVNSDGTATLRSDTETRTDLGLGTVAVVDSGTGVNTFLATPSSANLAAAVTDEMAGLGTKLAFGESGIEAAYTGTLTWTAGAAPSGASSLRQFYTEVGNLVTWQIMLTYATAGTTVTNLVLTFPTEFPTPAIPSGFTGANVKLYTAQFRSISTPSGTSLQNNFFFINRNAADNGFEISASGITSGTYRTFHLCGSYFTS